MAEIEVFIDQDGTIRGVYSQLLANLTKDLPADRRAPRVSNIFLGTDSEWYADLRKIHGPVLGPFPFDDRDAAVAAEEEWLNENYLPYVQEQVHG